MQERLFDKQIMQHCEEEYFPVAPIFFTKDLKFKLRALYQFARVTDNIADNHELSKENRVEALREVDELIMGDDYSEAPTWLQPYCKLVEDKNINKDCGHLLLSAFTQDLVQNRYEDWDGVIDYCNRSAVPIGRAILDIFEEQDADKSASDSLCYTLQLLNHVKDMKEDYVLHDRVFFPTSWYENVEDLGKEGSTESLEVVKHRVLDLVEEMLRNAGKLPATIKDFRLKAFYIYTLVVAGRVLRKLRKTDPLKQSIKIGTGEKILVLGRTFWQILLCRRPG